ncbi:anti-sigma factor family protein [Spirillospora sp. CA-294931]|uniref:anti-sigma factor family protein n=1 Tax=Spirillospora sp. CA-294931 TaxID=3240042 RepID=UPI003D8F1949
MNPAHLDYDTLADLAEGLLEDDTAASVNAHLDTCAECRDRSADLADVSRILAEAPVPSMPAELASRIDSAIAEESLNSATVVSLEQRRGRRHWRILSAAAATIVVLGGGAVVGKAALDGSSSSDHQSSAPARSRSAQADSSNEGAAKTAPSTRSVRPQIAPSEGAGAPPTSGVPVTKTGIDYRRSDLGTQVDRLLGKGNELKLDATPADRRLSECVRKVAGGRAPALVDRARFEGSPATIIALNSTEPGVWDIVVVGPACSATNPHILVQGSTK